MRVPRDTKARVFELMEEGIGRDRIAFLLDIPPSTVKQIMRGVHKGYSDSLSVRQVTNYIMQMGG